MERMSETEIQGWQKLSDTVQIGRQNKIENALLFRFPSVFFKFHIHDTIVRCQYDRIRNFIVCPKISSNV